MSELKAPTWHTRGSRNAGSPGCPGGWENA